MLTIANPTMCREPCPAHCRGRACPRRWPARCRPRTTCGSAGRSRSRVGRPGERSRRPPAGCSRSLLAGSDPVPVTGPYPAGWPACAVWASGRFSLLRRRSGSITPMASHRKSTKTSLQQRLSARARKRWPQLSGIDVRFRANFAYVTGRLPAGDNMPLMRLRYGVGRPLGLRDLPGRQGRLPRLRATHRGPGGRTRRRPGLRRQPLPRGTHRMDLSPDDFRARPRSVSTNDASCCRSRRSIMVSWWWSFCRDFGDGGSRG